jgi:hypothetical protein
MRRAPCLVRLAGAAALLLAIGSATWPAPPPAAAQSTSCVLQVTQPVPTPVPGSNPALAQNLRFTPQQKQTLCQAAESLERQNLALSRDLSSALIPGTLGPTGPLAFIDVAAHNAGPEGGAKFDVTVAAATSGLAGTVLLNTSLAGYLRALLDESSESSFTEVPQPSPPPFVFPSVSADTAPPAALTLRALLINESQAVGVVQTLLYSLRRARGAAAAGNSAIQAQQLRAAGISAGQLAALLTLETPLRLDAQGALGTTQGLPAILGDPVLVASLQAAAQSLGQFAVSQGVPLPAPPPPLPATVPVTLPPPPPPPAPPPAPAPADSPPAQ